MVNTMVETEKGTVPKSERRDPEEDLPEGGESCTVCGSAIRNEYCVTCGKRPNECTCK
jgi:hypothetical protein